MTLEETFEETKLTKREFRRLKRNALNEQFPKEKMPSSKPTYDIVAVKDLFRGTDVSEEVISQELQKIEMRRENKKNLPSKIINGVGLIKPLILIGCITGAILGNAAAKYINDLAEFDTLYDSVLIQYGDLNKDGIVNAGEEYLFRKEVLSKHNVIYYAGDRMVDSKYSNGKSVPPKTLTQWLKEYDQKNSSK